MSEGRKPAFNIRLSFRDGREQKFESFSGKEIASKWRNVGAAWPGKYEETPYSLSLEKGFKLVTPEGDELEISEIYLDLRKPYDKDAPKREGGSSKGKQESKPKTEKKRKAVEADPFA